MSVQTQELRTRLVWDTADVEKGEKRVLKAIDRLAAGEKKLSDKKKGGHGNDSNLTAGIRDLAEGRTLNALSRFTASAKAGGLAVAGLFAAFKIGRETIGAVREKMVATDTAAARLSETFQKLGRASAFASSADGAEALGGKIEGMREQNKSEAENRSEVESLANIRGSNFIAGGIVREMDRVRAMPIFGGNQTIDEKRAASDLRGRVGAKQATALERLRSDSLALDTGEAREGHYGSQAKLELLKSHRAELKEIKALEAQNAAPADLAAVREKFKIERAGIQQTAEARFLEYRLAKDLNEIRRAGANMEVATAEATLTAAEKRLQIETSIEGRRAAVVKMLEASEGLRQARQTAGERDINTGIDSRNANLRGSVDENAKAEAENEVMRAKYLLKLAHSDVEMKQAQVAVARSLRNEEELRIQTAVRRIDFERENRTAAFRIGAARVALGGKPDESAIAAAQAQIDSAKAGVEAAKQREKVERGSLDSVQARVAAQNTLTEAEIAMQQVQRDISILRADEMKLATAETDALKLSVQGYETRAEYAREMAASEVQIAKALREGHTQLAAQLRTQQDLGRAARMNAKFLNDDGTRRRAGVINAEVRDERKAAARIKRYDATHTFDPLTGKRAFRGDQKQADQRRPGQGVGDQRGEGGLESGGLDSGGLSSGGLRAGKRFGAGTDFRKAQGFRIDVKRRGMDSMLNGAGSDPDAWRANFRMKPFNSGMMDAMRKSPRSAGNGNDGLTGLLSDIATSNKQISQKLDNLPKTMA